MPADRWLSARYFLVLEWPPCGVLSGSGRSDEGQELKKFMVVTVVSFIVVGILIFIGLNLMTWLAEGIEAGNRPHLTPPPMQSQSVRPM